MIDLAAMKLGRRSRCVAGTATGKANFRDRSEACGGGVDTNDLSQVTSQYMMEKR